MRVNSAEPRFTSVTKFLCRLEIKCRAKQQKQRFLVVDDYRVGACIENSKEESSRPARVHRKPRNTYEPASGQAVFICGQGYAGVTLDPNGRRGCPSIDRQRNLGAGEFEQGNAYR